MRLRFPHAWLLLVIASPARADDPEARPRALSFYAFEGAFDGAHISTGTDYTLGESLDARGFVLRTAGGVGLSRYRIDPAFAPSLNETVQSARLLAGWREVGRYGIVTLFAGLALEARQIRPALPSPDLGARLGPAVVIDAWLTPMERVAVQIHAEYTTAYQAFSVKIAPGYALDRGLYAGPEFVLGRHHGSERLKLGLHVTGLALLGHQLRVSGGYAADRGGRAGFYAALALWRRY